jgi:hypothetical protein
MKKGTLKATEQDKYKNTTGSSIKMHHCPECLALG